jgi:hypothetical protein
MAIETSLSTKTSAAAVAWHLSYPDLSWQACGSQRGGWHSWPPDMHSDRQCGHVSRCGDCEHIHLLQTATHTC